MFCIPTQLRFALLLVAALVASPGCNAEQDAAERTRQSASKDSNDASPERESLDESSSMSFGNKSGWDADDYFKDDMDFDRDDFDYFTACKDVLSSSALKKDIMSWPKGLKKFLAKALDKFPAKGLVEDSLHGIYLIEKLRVDGGPPGVAGPSGLACGTEKKGSTNGRGLVFLSAESFIDTRKDFGPVDKYFREDGLSTEHVLVTGGDQSIHTLIHEVLHVIDQVQYFDREQGQPKAKRIPSIEASWKTYDKSKYDSIGIFNLAGAPYKPRPTACWPLKKPEKKSGFNLSSRSDAEDLEYMREETNFIAPYSMQNTFEDFAETISIYYMGTRYDDWAKWEAYRENLTEDPPETLLETFDTEKVLKSSKKHRKKLCMLVELVLDEDCEKKVD